MTTGDIPQLICNGLDVGCGSMLLIAGSKAPWSSTLCETAEWGEVPQGERCQSESLNPYPNSPTVQGDTHVQRHVLMQGIPLPRYCSTLISVKNMNSEHQSWGYTLYCSLQLFSEKRNPRRKSCWCFFQIWLNPVVEYQLKVRAKKKELNVNGTNRLQKLLRAFFSVLHGGMCSSRQRLNLGCCQVSQLTIGFFLFS